MAQSTFPFSRALVTGASSGIGRELARQLASGGVRLAVTARRKPELDSLAEEVERVGSEATVLPADLSRPSEAFRVVEEAEKALGGLDLLIANAGVGGTRYLVNLPWEEIQYTFMVNSLAPMALIRAALPNMIRRGSGYIAGISSLASYRGFPGNAHYSSSKAALSIFLESVRVETRPRGISVTDIHPGYIRTPLTEGHEGPMPFLMDVEHAARLILRAIAQKKRIYNFPWQMDIVLRLARILPPGIYDRVVSAGSRVK